MILKIIGIIILGIVAIYIVGKIDDKKKKQMDELNSRFKEETGEDMELR
jgi:hypothetical protein